MTIRNKLFSCLASLAVAIVLLAGVSLWSMHNSKTALDSILKDRVVPMRDLKMVADKYAVDIVDASHKARNGNLSFAQSSAKVRAGLRTLHEHWKAYRATRITGDEAALADEAEARMRVADERVAELQTILIAAIAPRSTISSSPLCIEPSIRCPTRSASSSTCN